MISPEQCRMGRAALNWSASDLASKAKVGVNTISRFETGHSVKEGSVLLIKTALENAGLRFSEEGCVCPGRAEGE